MRFSLEWLGDYVDPGTDPSRTGARLTSVGIPMDSFAPVDADTVLDLDVPTNRPDCMNHLGLARELAAAIDRPLKEPPADLPDGGPPPVSETASLEVEAPDLCDRYTALVIRGVQVRPSPAWLSRRLLAIGQRPINSVVDATNYVLWEMGQPLHAFDLARISGRKIRVRRARKGEPLTTLDGLDRKLDPETLVIADDLRAVAVAGVMGGRDSEISASTTEVLLESAHFNPVSVRRTARKLGIHTDASHRFERGADLEVTLRAAARCARLITEVAGGAVASGSLESRSAPPFSRRIPLRPARVRSLLGLEVPDAEIRKILERLGFEVSAGDPRLWSVSTPSFRCDLQVEEDLVEEVARHQGYDRIPTTLPKVLVFPEGRPEFDRRIQKVREAMLRCGFTEVMNLSLVSASDNETLGRRGSGIPIANPLAEGQDRLRTTLLGGLLRNVVHNLNHGAPEVRIFEIGRVFPEPPGPGKLPREEETLALACGGRGGLKHWSGPASPPDLFDVKGAVELAAHLVGVPAPAWSAGDEGSWIRPGTGAVLGQGGSSPGFAGELHPSLLASQGVEEPVYVAEISLSRFLASLPSGFTHRHAPLSRTPSVSRDLSLVLDRHHTYAEVERTILEVGDPSIARVSLFDRYQGKPVPAGKVSMAVNVVFQAPGRTLVSGEVAEIMDRIVQRLRDRLGAVLRGH